MITSSHSDATSEEELKVHAYRTNATKGIGGYSARRADKESMFAYQMQLVLYLSAPISWLRRCPELTSDASAGK